MSVVPGRKRNLQLQLLFTFNSRSYLQETLRLPETCKDPVAYRVEQDYILELAFASHSPNKTKASETAEAYLKSGNLSSEHLPRILTLTVSHGMGGQTHCQVTAATAKFSVVSDNWLADSGKVGVQTGSDSHVSFVFLSRRQKLQGDSPSEPVGMSTQLSTTVSSFSKHP